MRNLLSHQRESDDMRKHIKLLTILLLCIMCATVVGCEREHDYLVAESLMR